MHERFCHEDIWLPKPIGIRDHAHNDVAQLLIKFIGMAREIPEVGQVVPYVGKEIDPSKTGLLMTGW